MAPVEHIPGEQFIGLEKILFGPVELPHIVTGDPCIAGKDHPGTVGFLIPGIVQSLVVAVQGLLELSLSPTDLPQVVVGSGNVQGIAPLDILGHHEGGDGFLQQPFCFREIPLHDHVEALEPEQDSHFLVVVAFVR